ncbi:MAG: biopolymer transporter ExbD [archaeon]|nr:biopolymer transporter ExbD [archaeon]
MAIDVQSHKKKVLNQKLNFNFVPFIDILFTVMIFLVVTSNFAATDMQTNTADDATHDSSGKPVSDVSGSEEYFVVPVAGLHKVTVNGQDMSSLIRGSSIGVHATVMDQGEVIIKPGEIVIVTPSGFDVKKAVADPK